MEIGKITKAQIGNNLNFMLKKQSKKAKLEEVI